ncbi:MAG: hypothetical protein MHPDNHAH_00707 [Anaerolineales bacterium]|nr:hypothetical protein [Anaerolineales bacterium]
MNNVNVQTGIEHYKSGNKTDALKIFLEVLKREPNNEIVWLWLAACVENLEQKKDCFHKVLSINPNNTVAQKALAELELQAVSGTKPVLQSGVVLKCPSCGSVMGKPDHTGLVQCGYCGTAITYHPPVEKIERRNIERFLEMCKSALDGSNYDEALQYANKILEIDPENFDAWVNKAIASYWLTTKANNRFDEAMGYLLKAEKIDPANPVIETTRKSLMENQCRWYTYLGDQADEQSARIIEIYSSTADSLFGHMEAKEHCQEYVIEAMNYYFLASNYDSHDLTPLYKMRDLAKFGNWINWSPEIKYKISSLERIEQKNHATNRLPGLRKQLQEAITRLAKLEKEKGFLSGMKIDGVKRDISSLKQQIAQCEQIIGF